MTTAVLLLASLVTSSTSTQAEQSLLLPEEPVPFQEFGRSVALRGERAVVGARGAFGEEVYVFERDGGVWVQRAALGGFFLSSFGEDVALDGERFVVGAPQDGGPGFGVVYARIGRAWAEEAFLFPSVATPALGTSVGLEADVAVLGGEGRAVVFERAAGGWSERALLLPFEPTTSFGSPVAISGHTIAVGGRRAANGRGVVFLFERLGGVWLPAGTLAASDVTEGEGFGAALAFEGDTLAGFSPARGGSIGAVYLFQRCAGVWEPGPRLVPEGDLDALGEAFVDLALGRTTLVVGAVPFPGSTNARGGAWVFEHDRGAWEEARRLVASDAAAAASLGRSVAVSGRDVLVGANLAPVSGFPSGSVHAYRLPAHARVVLYGRCADGADSLAVVGEPLVGGTLAFVLDDPTGRLAPGAHSLLVVAAAPDPAFPGGSPLPPVGELLVDVGSIEDLRPGTPWNGPLDPARVELPVPLVHAFVGRVFYCQGLLVDREPPGRAALTAAALVEIAF